MVARVVLARGEHSPEFERRRDRAAELRAEALRLAEEDAAAYRAAMEAPSESRREAFAAAADPPLAIAEAAAETRALGVASADDVDGPVSGEAETAILVATVAARAAHGSLSSTSPPGLTTPASPAPGSSPRWPPVRRPRARLGKRRAGRAPGAG